MRRERDRERRGWKGKGVDGEERQQPILQQFHISNIRAGDTTTTASSVAARER